ncbi:DUF504 domain-containing protein [Desulfurococcus amylolyticus]|uniref:MJ1316 RNA cyclic group end recognition domain-containing protein n=1 Tax=Desulfurococcus amylolyticus (strain DSM 18924 / JCM 16383 / VKM B-2413 / 1221n) TaxID=490899 RepID=B8D6P7_DESA1|nr:RNA repair domain-containing protein [Desulfurococcus amylolyticus]ACL11778.1 Protein of unknown function DUF504 [Desulfurococcus amylolyticus 1221n]
MGRKRGELENWLRRIVFGGFKNNYVIYIRYRAESGEILKPVPGELIIDLRAGYIYTHNEIIPLHRVEEIRDKNNRVLYKRGKNEG